MKIQEINGDFDDRTQPRIKKQKRVKRKHTWLKFILVAVILIASVVLLALTPIFNIRHIDIKGSERYNQEDILGATDIVMGNNGFKTIGGSLKNIIKFRYKKAEEDILKSHPYIKSVTIKFVIPSKIKIDITERKEMGIISFMSTNLIVDKEGYVLASVADTEGYNLPSIKGIKLENFNVGQEIESDNAEKLDTVVRVLEAISSSDSQDKPLISDLVKAVDVSDLEKTRILIDSRITVNLGNIGEFDDEVLNYRLNFFRQIYTKNLTTYDKGTLDFSSGKNPSFIPEE